MTTQGSRLAWAFCCALALSLGARGVLHAQQQRVPAVVDYIAGTSIYLAVGTDQGIVTNDTITVAASVDGEPVGQFLVVSATATRAVVEFLGAPFAVTRGATLYLQPGAARRGAAAAVDVAAATTPRQPSGRSPSLHGRLSLEANAFSSETRWQSNEPVSVTRKFATPAFGLRAVAADLPGGLNVNTNLRILYRYSDPAIITPQWATQVYQASLSKSFGGSVPVYFEAGRFINPYASLSGVWDGLVMHVGGRGLGGGVAAGFEPRWGDQAVTTDLPKYSAFLTYDVGDGPWRYATDVAVQYLRPRNGLADHTSGIWSQVLRVQRFRLGSDVQVDRDSTASSWTVTRFNAVASVPLTTGLDLRARVSRYQPYLYWQTAGFLPFRRDQGNVGLFFWRPAGSFNLDVTAARLEGGEWSYTYAGGFGLYRTPVMGLDFNASGTYWSQNGYTAIYGTGGIARSFGLVMAAASYQFYRAGDASFRSVSHTGDLRLSFPLARTVFATLQGRVQRGDNLWTNGLFAGLWTSF